VYKSGYCIDGWHSKRYYIFNDVMLIGRKIQRSALVASNATHWSVIYDKYNCFFLVNGVTDKKHLTRISIKKELQNRKLKHILIDVFKEDKE